MNKEYRSDMYLQEKPKLINWITEWHHLGPPGLIGHPGQEGPRGPKGSAGMRQRHWTSSCWLFPSQLKTDFVMLTCDKDDSGLKHLLVCIIHRWIRKWWFTWAEGSRGASGSQRRTGTLRIWREGRERWYHFHDFCYCFVINVYTEAL